MIITFDLRAALAAARNSVAALSRDQAGDASVTALDTLLAGIDGGGELVSVEPEAEGIEAEEVEQAERDPDIMLGQAHEPEPARGDVHHIADAREMVAASHGPVQAEPTEGRVWTPDRDAQLLAMKALSPAPSWREIMDALNGMPGARIVSANGESCKVRFFKLRRAGVVGVASPLASVPAEDMAEARQMMTASSSVGAKALADYFGWSLDTAQQVAIAIRAEQEGGAK